MKTINPNIYPNGGYFFLEADNTRVFGDSWPGVISRVRWYRRKNGRPEGDITSEVMTQACQRNPDLCTEAVNNAAVMKRQPLKSRVLTWLNHLRADKGRTFVEESVSRERAAICAQCHNNEGLPGGCASCKAALKALRDEVLGKKFVDGRLSACKVLGEDLPTSVHMEIQAVDEPELPPQCWRKRK